MTLVRYNPNRFFDNSFDRFFTNFPPPVPVNGSESAHAAIFPRVEIRDGEEAIHLTAEVPGIEKDQLKVEVNNRVLTVSGEKLVENEQKENGITRSERVYGSFTRRFTLPDEVDADKIVANTDNGVLNVTLPKKPEAKPKVIDIGSGKGGAKNIDVS